MSHEQVEIWLPTGAVEVDEQLGYIIQEINRNGIPTRASCQNYGEFLRSFKDLDHMLFSKVDYGYIEFDTVEFALEFLGLVKGAVAPIDPLTFRLSHQGTPDAWEVRYVLEWNIWWVMFPQSDIVLVEEAMRNARRDSK